MSFSDLLNLTCTIQEQQKAQTNTGQITVSWMDKLTDVKTRKNVSRIPTVTEALGKVTVIETTFYFESDVDIAQGDRIVLDTEIYDVITVVKDSSQHHLEVLASKISFE